MRIQKTEEGKDPLLPKTISQLLIENSQQFAKVPSMHAELQKGTWTSWNWEEVFNISFRFAKSLVAI